MATRAWRAVSGLVGVLFTELPNEVGKTAFPDSGPC